ncbi:MAG: alpha-2-macroglobulin family protein [Polyangiaceae bacterium]
MNRPLGLLLLSASLLLLPTACPGGKPAETPGSTPGSSAQEGPVRVSKSGLGFRIQEEIAGDVTRAKVASATPLADAEAKKLLGRLPALPPDPDAEKAFALRPGSLPSPKVAKTITESFPPPSDAPVATATTGPLRVLRHAPDGAVPIAPHVTVTFSRPMVAVTSLAELAKLPPPATITPAVKGAWRWLGTDTAVFEPETRMPMATTFGVEVAAGTKSVTGESVAEGAKWSFTTPPPTMTRFLPQGGTQKRDVVFYAEFDQDVDADALLKAVRVTSGGKSLDVRLATDADLDGAPSVVLALEKAPKRRAIAFRAKETLPSGATVSVTFPKGTPSAEGPRTTEKDQGFEVHTYGPLVVKKSRCGYENKCTPQDTFEIAFSNVLDAVAFSPAKIRVSPEPATLRTNVQGDTLYVTGPWKGRSKVTVTVAADVVDVFGQTLGAEKKLTFDVGAAEPELFGAPNAVMVLDPAGKREVPIFTVNVPEIRVKAYAVTPQDWDAYQAALRDFRGYGANPGPKAKMPGKLVFDRTVRTTSGDDAIVATSFDLTPFLTGGFGHVIVDAENPRPKDARYRESYRTWVQSTQIGLGAYRDQDGVVAWTSALGDGAPLAGVDVSFDAGRGNAKSAADGLARLGDPSSAKLLVAKRGADTTFLASSGSWDGFFEPRTLAPELHWFVFDDRGMYKPGEKAKLKGYLRAWDPKKGGDLQAADVGSGRVKYVVRDARGTEILQGEAAVDASGAFDVGIELPKNANLGTALVTFDLVGSTYAPGSANHVLQVQEFRKPEFEVTASASGAPYFVGGHGNVLVEAKYYAGGGLPQAPVHWTVTRETGHYAPPNHPDWSFGEAREWWWESFRSRHAQPRTPPSTLDGVTDPLGRHGLRVDFDAVTPSFPMSLRFSANVTDVNRQAWSAEAKMLVHPADVYVGLKLARPFVKAGEALPVETLVTDVDGVVTPGRAVSVSGERIEWIQKAGEWVETVTTTATCDLTSSKDPVRCNVTTKEAGKYRIVATVTDARGRKNRTESHVWVVGADAPKEENVRRDAVTVLPNRSEYAAGDTAEILVVAPFAPVEGVLTVRRQGIVHLERFATKESSTVLKVPVSDALVPGATIHVDVVGAIPREDGRGMAIPNAPKRPAFASGTADLKVPPTSRTLAVTVAPTSAKVDPGAKTKVTVDVKAPTGEAIAGANVTVIVADEAVLALQPWTTPKLVDAFYGRRPDGTSDRETRSLVTLADPSALARPGGAMGGGLLRETAYAAAPMASPPPAASIALAGRAMAKKAEAQDDASSGSPIATRTNFEALAAFVPNVVTDAKGHAEVPVTLPDNLTRYRIVAVATSGARHFGTGESSITARLPLMVRPSLPRFLNFGDTFEMAVVLQNQTDSALEVSLAARTANASITGPAGRRVSVPANDRVEVRIPAKAEKAGKARFQIAAAAGTWADASLVELPVWTPATTEAFATYGQIDSGAIERPVTMPKGVVKEFGGVEITTSSTAVAELTDAVLYLVKYPYDCNEQIASRILTIAALRDVLTAFHAEGMPRPEALEASMKEDLETLRRRQGTDGGFGFWNGETWPYLSIHVAHALERAKTKGYAVPPQTLERAKTYLRSVESHIPSWYSPESKRALVAYALYVRNRLGDADRPRAKRLLAEAGGVDKTPLESLGWILPVLSADAASGTEVRAIRKLLENRVEETAGNAHFTTSYSDGAHVLLHSERRTDGVLLEALIGDQPTSPVIPKLVKGLLAHRTKGRWTNTQESAFILLALDRYFATYEKETPNFTARAWLGGKFVAEHAFKGRTTEESAVTVPLSFLATLVPNAPVVLAKDGPGRLYWRVGMRYAPEDLTPEPVSAGFTVERTYEGVDAASDVTRTNDGTWHVKAGAKVRVRLRMLAPARRYHVALVDGLPAGFEPMNAALAVTGDVPDDDDGPRSGKRSPSGRRDDFAWYWGPWYEHQNMRDDRVEAFASLLREGFHEYVYVARATSLGTFVAPPPKAEEMYAPETFGRGAGDRVVVE